MIIKRFLSATAALMAAILVTTGCGTQQSGPNGSESSSTPPVIISDGNVAGEGIVPVSRLVDTGELPLTYLSCGYTDGVIGGWGDESITEEIHAFAEQILSLEVDTASMEEFDKEFNIYEPLFSHDFIHYEMTYSQGAMVNVVTVAITKSGTVYLCSTGTESFIRSYTVAQTADYDSLWSKTRELMPEEVYDDSELLDLGSNIPEMSPAMQEYANRYMMAWVATAPFDQDFNEENPPMKLDIEGVYVACADELAGSYNENRAKYDLDLPADVVESAICAYLPLTPEQIRSQLPHAGTENDVYYNSQTGTYHFVGGAGSLGYMPVVHEAKQNGDVLTLDCTWYNQDDGSMLYRNEVTIRLGQSENEFRYIDNKVTEITDQARNR